MELLKTTLQHPFTWGLLLGLLFTALSLGSHWKTRRELRRYQRHLSDKLEVEAAALEALRRGKAATEKENERLRVRIASLNERPDQRMQRDLEILARAEKLMTLNAPGFAQAWETAKSRALDEVTREDQGKTLPQRIYRRLFGETGVDEKGFPTATTMPAGADDAAEGAAARHD